MAEDFFKGGFGDNERGVGGVFNGQEVTFSVGQSGDGGISGALVQQIQIQYQRQINRINEIGSNWVYYSVGQIQGQGTVQNILGPSSLVQEMIETLGDICKVSENTIRLAATQNFCDTGEGDLGGDSGSFDLEIGGPILTSIGITMSVQDLMIMSSASFEFANLKGNA